MRALLAILLVAFALRVAPAHAQAQPHSRIVTLFPSQALPGVGTYRGSIIGSLGAYRHGACQLDVNAFSATTLDVYIQAYPNGVLPDDYLHFTTVAATASRVHLVETTLATTTAQTHVRQDLALAAASGGFGSFGDRLSVAAVIAGGAGTATLSVTCQFSTQ
jgi:hypothetical protein